MSQGSFLIDAWVGWTWPRSAVLDHMEHICDLVGDSVCALGTDYDGAIIPPSDLPDITDHPLLVQDMLDRGWSDARIRGILGGNYLRVVREMRP